MRAEAGVSVLVIVLWAPGGGADLTYLQLSGRRLISRFHDCIVQ
jgi:hypothetical protein